MLFTKNLSGASWRSLSWGLHGAGCAVAGALVLAGSFLYAFQVHEQDRVQREYLRAENCLKNADATQRTYQALRQRQQREQARIEQLLRRVPVGPAESEFLALLADLSKQCDFSVRSFRPGGISSSGTFSQMEISLACDGTYESLCRFLDGLESLPRLCRVAGVSISAASEAGDRCTVELQLQLLFSRPDSPKPPAA